MDLEWDAGKLTGAALRSEPGGDLRVRYRDTVAKFKVRRGGKLRLDAALRPGSTRPRSGG